MKNALNIAKIWHENEKKNSVIFSVIVFSTLLGFISLFVWLVPNYSKLVPAINKLDYNTYKCTGQGESNETFSIYSLSYHSAKFLADSLCNDPRVSKRVGVVEAQWRHQNITDLSILQNRRYDLLIAHARHVERAAIQGITGYKRLASYAPYTSYLIGANGENVELSSKYFTGKRIGLRDNPLSQSGRILPLQALRETGVDEDLVEIIYFKSHFQLRKALMKGEVDVIGSYWSEQDKKRYGDLPRIKLEKVDPSNWYFLPSNLDVSCAISDALNKLKNSEKGYFSGLNIKPICTEKKI